MSDPKVTAAVLAELAAQNVTLSVEFVPQSKSRHAADVAKNPSINWRVTLSRPGASWSTDYSQGYGHLGKLPDRINPRSLMGWGMIQAACETGRAIGFGAGRLAAPAATDIMYSLCLDARALDSACFEDWAADHGYELDSRSAEATYRACLEIALQLRAMLGSNALDRITVLVQDL